MSFMRCRYKNPSSDSWKALHSWMATTTSMVFRQPTWLSKINRLTLPKSLWALQTSWKWNFRRFLIARTWVGWSRISRHYHWKVVDPKRQTQTVEVVPFGQNYCTSTVLYMICGGVRGRIGRTKFAGANVGSRARLCMRFSNTGAAAPFLSVGQFNN